MSFAWVAWDVLEQIHNENKAIQHSITCDPIGDALSNHIIDYVELEKNKEEYFNFCKMLNDHQILKQYLEKNIGKFT